ncbi:hypothetical protein L873DRAFT_204154 [Choiromyces venosus 120613-1]|uniref:Uncharacterized protein n=1 Tax=Choiromyces venosus 120613-1 TaxID=1336337 RepID=A0A3N4J4X7_9PEZI|nr:hypothetical protein L873DRAFT_204154 [Choiromyces venosus 120613-1]
MISTILRIDRRWNDILEIFPPQIKGRKHSEKIAFQPSTETNKKQKTTDPAR